jgi:esterase
MPYLDNFNYQILGEGAAPKLVFLHGLMGSGTNWRKITPGFVGDFQILLFDQRGHGRSFQPLSGYSPEDYASDIKKIVDELGWNKFHLVGHSMGGRNALVFADLHPQYIDKLVIEDIGPDLNHESGEKIKRLIDLVPVPFPSRSVARDFFQTTFLELIKNHSDSRVLSQYFYTNIAETANKQADWRFSKAGVFASLNEGRTVERWKELQNLIVPTLLIRGEHSKELYPEVYNNMLLANDNITGIVVPGAGHWVHAEKPLEFINILRKFLTS